MYKAKFYPFASIAASGGHATIGNTGDKKDKQLGMGFSKLLRELAKLPTQVDIPNKKRRDCHEAAQKMVRDTLGEDWEVVYTNVSPVSAHYWNDGWKPCTPNPTDPPDPAKPPPCPTTVQGFELKYNDDDATDPLMIFHDNQSLECRYYVAVEY